MKSKEFATHILDVLKGAVAAAIVAAVMAFIQYLGAHIPDALEILGGPASAVAMIKATRAGR